jgi:hypothetical protein
MVSLTYQVVHSFILLKNPDFFFQENEDAVAEHSGQGHKQSAVC